MVNLITDLQSTGLTEKEAKIYLAMLELGEDTVQNISARAKVNRPTTYLIIDNLIKKGLCSLSKISGTAKYTAENPVNLLQFINSEKENLNKKEVLAKNLIKNLGLLPKPNKNNESFIKYFSGKRGMVAMRNDMFKDEGVSVRMLYSLDNYQKTFNAAERDEMHAMRIGKKIFAKILYTSNKLNIKNNKSLQAKKIDKKYVVGADIAIYGSKIRLASFDGLNGVVINNKKIADSLSALFDMAWISSKDK